MHDLCCSEFVGVHAGASGVFRNSPVAPAEMTRESPMGGIFGSTSVCSDVAQSAPAADCLQQLGLTLLCFHGIISYHIVGLKWQNRLRVGLNKPKLKVKMQSVSDDDVRRNFLKSHV